MDKRTAVESMLKACEGLEDLEGCMNAAYDELYNNHAKSLQSKLKEHSSEKMLAAWQDFKATGLFSVLLAHLERADKLLASEGTIWGFFYNGYLAGYKSFDSSTATREPTHGKETV
jgi:hypothetical protein